MADEDCLLCDAAAADAFFERQRVWEDDLWRLSVVLRGAVPGFSHLESKRHIAFITDLDGAEASSLGGVLARSARLLRRATDADKVYVYVFGDRVPHLHVNLAPHVDGDALVGGRGLLAAGTPDVATTSHLATALAVAAAFRDA